MVYHKLYVLRFCRHSFSGEMEIWSYKENFINGNAVEKLGQPPFDLNFSALFEGKNEALENIYQIQSVSIKYVYILDQLNGLFLISLGKPQELESLLFPKKPTPIIIDQFAPSNNERYFDFQIIQKNGNIELKSRFKSGDKILYMISEHFLYQISGNIENDLINKQIQFQQNLKTLLGQRIIENYYLKYFLVDANNFYIKYLPNTTINEDGEQNNNNDDDEVLAELFVIRNQEFPLSIKQQNQLPESAIIFAYQIPGVFYQEMVSRVMIVVYENQNQKSLVCFQNTISHMLEIETNDFAQDGELLQDGENECIITLQISYPLYDSQENSEQQHQYKSYRQIFENDDDYPDNPNTICQNYDKQQNQKYTVKKVVENIQVQIIFSDLDDKVVKPYSNQPIDKTFTEPDGAILLNSMFQGPALEYDINNQYQNYSSSVTYVDYNTTQKILSKQQILEKQEVQDYILIQDNSYLMQFFRLSGSSDFFLNACEFYEKNNCVKFKIGDIDSSETILKVFYYKKSTLLLVITDQTIKNNCSLRYSVILQEQTSVEMEQYQFGPYINIDTIQQVINGDTLLYTKNQCIYTDFPFFSEQDENSISQYDSESKCITFSTIEYFEYMDYSLLDYSIFFAKQNTQGKRKKGGITVFYIDFQYELYNASREIYTYYTKNLPQVDFHNFDFVIVRTERVKLIIIDYNNNTIVEYGLYSYDNPTFLRYYTTLGKKFDQQKGLQVSNDMIVAHTEDGESMFWWTQGQSIDNLNGVYDNKNNNIKVAQQTSILFQQSKQQNLILQDNQDFSGVQLFPPQLISKLGLSEDQLITQYNIKLNAMNELDQKYKSQKNIVTRFQNQDFFIKLKESPQEYSQNYTIMYEQIKIHVQDIMEGPIQDYSLGGKDKDFFELQKYITNKEYKEQSIDAVIQDVSPIFDFLMIVTSSGNDNNNNGNDSNDNNQHPNSIIIYQYQNQEQTLEQEQPSTSVKPLYVCPIKKLIKGLNDDEQVNTIIYSNTISSNIQYEQAFLNIRFDREDSEKRLFIFNLLFFIDLYITTDQNLQGWESAFNGPKIMNIQKIQNSATNLGTFEIKQDNIKGIVSIQLDNLAAFYVTVTLSNVDIKDEQNDIVYILLENRNQNPQQQICGNQYQAEEDGEFCEIYGNGETQFLNLVNLYALTSFEINFNWLFINDLYETHPQQKYEDNKNLWNSQILFNCKGQTINSVWFSIDIGKQVATLDKYKRFDINKDIQNKSQTDFVIIKTIYKLESSFQSVDITVVTQDLLFTGTFSTSELDLKNVIWYNEYSGCQIPENEFQPGQISFRGDYLLVYCEGTQYLQKKQQVVKFDQNQQDFGINFNDYQYQNDDDDGDNTPKKSNKYIKLFLTTSQSNSILQMINLPADINEKQLIMRFIENDNQIIYGLNIFSLKPNLITQSSYTVQDYLQIYGTQELWNSKQNLYHLDVKLVAQNNFQKSVEYDLDVRGYIHSNYLILSFLIFSPLIISIIVLIIHCVITAKRNHTRIVRIRKQFEDAGRPLEGYQEGTKDELLKALLKNEFDAQQKVKSNSSEYNQLGIDFRISHYDPELQQQQLEQMEQNQIFVGQKQDLKSSFEKKNDKIVQNRSLSRNHSINKKDGSHFTDESTYQNQDISTIMEQNSQLEQGSGSQVNQQMISDISNYENKEQKQQQKEVDISLQEIDFQKSQILLQQQKQEQEEYLENENKSEISNNNSSDISDQNEKKLQKKRSKKKFLNNENSSCSDSSSSEDEKQEDISDYYQKIGYSAQSYIDEDSNTFY